MKRREEEKKECSSKGTHEYGFLKVLLLAEIRKKIE
jgi:hypothetical protein